MLAWLQLITWFIMMTFIIRDHKSGEFWVRDGTLEKLTWGRMAHWENWHHHICIKQRDWSRSPIIQNLGHLPLCFTITSDEIAHLSRENIIFKIIIGCINWETIFQMWIWCFDIDFRGNDCKELMYTTVHENLALWNRFQRKWLRNLFPYKTMQGVWSWYFGEVRYWFVF